ncbi:MAG: hypothetical protein E7062_06360 [Spirochaetaceae bacterium]|nr:hypothetical protein [Spirochaetaceae bacterium]
MNTLSEEGLQKAYLLLKKGNPEHAKLVLEEALSYDLEGQEILQTLKCATYWADKLQRISFLPEPFERGESIITQWKLFSNFIVINGITHEEGIYATKMGVFSKAVDYFQQLLRDRGIIQKREIYVRLGICYKKLGDYEKALSYLVEANAKENTSPLILAEMADCYALCGEDKIAKVLFREAFFIDAQKVDILLLESDLFLNLKENVEKLGFRQSELAEWIPVYGVLLGVFTVKRELKAVEFARLKQNIYTLENELREVENDSLLLTPRLLNHYFWLIDYYTTQRDSNTKIHEVLLKIKLLDSDIYEKYTI